MSESRQLLPNVLRHKRFDVHVASPERFFCEPSSFKSFLDVETEISDVGHELQAMLHRRFSSDPSVAYVSLGERLDLSDPRVSFDQMHLTFAGNEQAAAAFVEPVLALASRRKSRNF